MPLRLNKNQNPRPRRGTSLSRRGHVRRSKTPWIAPPPPQVPRRVREFFAEVPRLFSECLESEKDDYEGVIYRMARPLTPGMIARAIGFRAAEVKRLEEHDLALLASAIQKARYPDPRPLLLASRVRLPLDAAVRALHFANPAFPLWDAVVARGAKDVAGERAPMFSPRFDRNGMAQYARFVRMIATWREAISFHHVPEEPYFLGRILEGALVERAGRRPSNKKVT